MLDRIGWWRADDLPDLAVSFRQQVQLAGAIAAEVQVHPLVASQVPHRLWRAGLVEEPELVKRSGLPAAAHLPLVRVEDAAVDDVAEDVFASELGPLVAAIHKPSGHGAAN